MGTPRDHLRRYFQHVAADLVRRGVVRRQRGQALDDIVRKEATTVVGAVWEDLVAVGTEMGLSFAAGVASMTGSAVHHGVDELLGWGVKKVVEMVKGGKK